jgi:AcrR family transcriptional regulator
MDPKELKEQAIKDAKCKLILDAANKAFKEKGIWNTRMEDIAAIAGFSKPSLYNYYADKESIVISLAIREAQTFYSSVASIAAQDGLFIEIIEKTLRSQLTRFAENLSMIIDVTDYQRITSVNVDITKHKNNLSRFQEIFTDFLHMYASIIKKGRNSGEICSTLSDDFLALMVVSMTQAVCQNWKMQGKTDNIDTTISQLLDFIKNGFAIKSGNI